MPAVTAAELSALLEAHAFTRRLRAEVSFVGEGECALQVPHNPEHDRPGGIVSGPVYMHAADVAFWFAIKTLLGLEDPSVTSQMTTAFLGSARGEGFECRARVIRCGKRLVYGTAECTVGERVLTHHTLTYARGAGRDPAAP